MVFRMTKSQKNEREIFIYCIYMLILKWRGGSFDHSVTFEKFLARMKIRIFICLKNFTRMNIKYIRIKRSKRMNVRVNIRIENCMNIQIFIYFFLHSKKHARMSEYINIIFVTNVFVYLYIIVTLTLWPPLTTPWK